MAQQQGGGDAIGRRYELLRKRQQQQGTRRQQLESDALKRQAAQAGMVGSGAMIKQSQLASQQREKDLAQAQEGLDVSEQGERFQQEQIKAQRDFQRGEREASQQFAAEQAGIGRDFAAEQAGIGREFARAERLGAQNYQAAQADKQRGFSKNLFDREMQFKEQSRGIQQSQFKQQFDQALKQFELDEEVTRFNMDMAMKQFNKKDMTEWLMGGAHGGEILNDRFGIDFGMGGGGGLGGSGSNFGGGYGNLGGRGGGSTGFGI